MDFSAWGVILTSYYFYIFNLSDQTIKHLIGGCGLVVFSLFISGGHAGVKFHIVHFIAGFRACYRNRGAKR